MTLTTRPAVPADAPAITAIYNQGIEDRVGTFETSARTPEQIATWFADGLPIVVATKDVGEVVAYAAAFAYSDRCVYGGIAEFSVYVRRDWRGRGAGSIAMLALIEGARGAGLWKLLSRIFPENAASRALMRKIGFREVGVHEKHGKLDGVWKDVVLVELGLH